MEQGFCFGAQGLAQEFPVQPLDLGIFVGEPEAAALVQGPELFTPHAFQFLVLLGNGLAAPTGAAARIPHFRFIIKNNSMAMGAKAASQCRRSTDRFIILPLQYFSTLYSNT